MAEKQPDVDSDARLSHSFYLFGASAVSFGFIIT